MMVQKQPSRASALIVGLNLVVGLAGLLAWFAYTPAVPAIDASTYSPLASLLLPVVLAWAGVSAMVLTVAPGVSRTLRIVSVLSLLLLVPGLSWFRRYSALGVIGLGGGRYWVQQAAEAATDEDAALHLRRVIGSSRYGVDVAESAVLRLSDRGQQSHLFVLLAGLVAWPTWQQRYLERAAEARSGAGG